MISAVLFDVDGTLITSGGASGTSWRQTFEALYGITVDVRDFSDNGMTDPEVGRRALAAILGREPSERELGRALATRLDHMPQAVAESPLYRVLPGVEALLPRLVSAGHLVGLTTGGTETAARIKLARGGLNRYFEFGGFGSDSPDRTELTRCALRRAAALSGNGFDPSRALVVGDTPLDVAAAHGAGAISVAVASGDFDADALRAAGADHVLASLEEELPL